MGTSATSDGPETAPGGPATFHLLADTPWEQRGETPENLRAVADQTSGSSASGSPARRAQVTTGALGMHTQLSEMPAGFTVPLHSHSAHELMIVLEGGCTISGGQELTAGDMVEVPGGTEYGFTVGSDGIRFVVVRPEASITHLS